MFLIASRIYHQVPKFCHEQRADLLFGLSCLLGCVVRRRMLSVGSIPDVVAMSINGSVLFVGDAKYSEPPDDPNCRARVYRYIRIAKECLGDSTELAVFALCYGKGLQGTGWRELIQLAAHESGLNVTSCRTNTFLPNSHIIVALLNSLGSPNGTKLKEPFAIWI